jgi:hypothetical protein
MPLGEASALGRLGQLAGIVLLLVGLGLGAWGAPYYMLDWGSAAAIAGAVFAVGGLLSLLLGSALLRLDALRRSLEGFGEARGREPAFSAAAPVVFPTRPTTREFPASEPSSEMEPRGSGFAATGAAVGAAAGGLALSGRAILGAVAQADDPGKPLTASRDDAEQPLPVIVEPADGASADSSTELLARLDRELASARWPEGDAVSVDRETDPSHDAAADHGERMVGPGDEPSLEAAEDQALERPSTELQLAQAQAVAGPMDGVRDDALEAAAGEEAEPLLTSADRASLDELLARLDQPAPPSTSAFDPDEAALPGDPIRDALYARIEAATQDLGAVRDVEAASGPIPGVESSEPLDADWRENSDESEGGAIDPFVADADVHAVRLDHDDAGAAQAGAALAERPDFDGPASDWGGDESASAWEESEPLPEPAPVLTAPEGGDEAQADNAPQEAVEPQTAPMVSDEGVVAAYTVGDSAYAMLADGRIRVTTPEGLHLFQSMEELKAFMAARRAGQSA